MFGKGNEGNEMNHGRMEVKVSKEGKEWTLYSFGADDLLPCGESGDNLRLVIGRFLEVWEKGSIK